MISWDLKLSLAAADVADDARHIDGRACTVGADFAAERPFLLPLPADRFDTALSLSPGRPLTTILAIHQVAVLRRSLESAAELWGQFWLMR